MFPLSFWAPPIYIGGSMATDQLPRWRVKMWFLTDKFGISWVGLEFPFLKAKDRDKAIMYCTERAITLGFTVNKDTVVEANRDNSDSL